jgi:hypothetical protein
VAVIALLLEVTRATQAQHALLGGDLDVRGLHARQVGAHRELFGLFVDVDGWRPGGIRGVGVESLVKLAAQAVQQAPRLISYDGHLQVSSDRVG